jgi:peptidoglycan/xylan/chitin deacetylase (PgdA/CDA1 family)/predicted ATP-grasp superfamily ATP-dependent carboligase
MSDGRLVLCYHAVSNRWPCELAIPAERLQRQLEALLERGYRAVTFSALVAASPAAKLLAVTFDDGFQSTIANGAPVLDRLGIPATVFVPSAFVGTRRLSWPGIDQWLDGPFADELAAVSWATLRALAEAGWEVGSHTCTHARLPTLSDERLEQELRRSRAVIEERLERPCRSLAYPFGAVDRRVIAAVRSAGYDSAAALPIRLDRPTALAWPRVGIYGTDGPWRFRIKVSRAGRAVRETPVAAPMLAAHRLSLTVSETTACRHSDGVAPVLHGLRRADVGASGLHRRARADVAGEPAVLVTDAEERSIVAVTRALAGGGYRVGAVASSPRAAAHWSRCCAERLWLADPLRDEAGYVDGLERALRTDRYAVFIPGSDPALLIASRHRARLEPHVRIGLPPHATVLRSLDKLALTQAVVGTGLVVPETVLCAGVDEACGAARELGFPVALKPRSSVFECGGALRHLPGRIVHSEAELAHVAPAYGEHCLLQRYETGALLAYGGVIADGRLLASSLARSWRTHRPDSGSLAFCEAIEVPPSLRASVAELLRRIGHEGIFELDLLERSDGSIALLDLNPRPYGALALAVRGGANLPKIWCDWLLNRDPREVDAEPGALFRWEDADLFHLACRLRQHQLGAAASVLLPHRNVVHAYFAATDPGPFAARMLWLLGDFTRNGFTDRRERGVRLRR